jgi:acetylglutamate kinase
VWASCRLAIPALPRDDLRRLGETALYRRARDLNNTFSDPRRSGTRTGDAMYEEAIRKADVLIEALRYILKLRGRYTVIKLGGSVMEDPESLRALLVDIVFMQTVGLRPVIVHGGGKAINFAMAQANLEPRFVQGRRFTDDATLAIVARVLGEEVNADIVRHIIKFGGRAGGLHHHSTQCLFGTRLTLTGTDGEPVDLGRVGEVTRVEVGHIESMCLGGVVPVLPSLAEDEEREGELLNVNADTAAAAVAAALRAEKLVFLTDTAGILRDRNEPDSLITSLKPDECRELIEHRVIESGMIPKVEACLESLTAGVRKVHIIDGRLRHSLLLEIFTDRGIGTEIEIDSRVPQNGSPTTYRRPASIDAS